MVHSTGTDDFKLFLTVDGALLDAVRSTIRSRQMSTVLDKARQDNDQRKAEHDREMASLKRARAQLEEEARKFARKGGKPEDKGDKGGKGDSKNGKGSVDEKGGKGGKGGLTFPPP